jgi:hypothetical protein
MTSPGDVLNDRYELVRRLGGGTMGTVWEAFDGILERTVAVKQLARGPFGDESGWTRQERIKREAIALAQVEHPVIVTVHDLIFDGRDKVPWIVMAYVPGRPLHDIIADHKDAPLPERKIAAIAHAVLEGLLACHTSNPRVYHRDVKPANIIVGPDGSVHLVDFGIARIAGKEPLTEGHSIIGTAEFLAPELLDGEEAGPGTDLWALGVTLYYALTGQAPFWAETTGAILAAIKFRNPPEPRDGGQLASLVLQMLRKQPQDRPDAAKVATILRGVASQPAQPAGQAYWTGPRYGADHLGDAWTPREQPPPRHWTAPRPVRQQPPLTALSGLPVPAQAQLVAGMPTDQAAAELLVLSRHDAAKIINRCDDALAGNLLSAIAIAGEPPAGKTGRAAGAGEAASPGEADEAGGAGDKAALERSATARKILQMLPPDRQGPLLDHMSSVALAAMLTPPRADVRVQPRTADTAASVDQAVLAIVGRADIATVVGAVSEMAPASAAPLVLAMSPDRASDVLRRTAPARVADIIRCVCPASRGQQLLSRLPERTRASVLRYLG